ncbi:MAG TPA: hypothetical protein VFS60_13435 [Thermoanaerobaculia bacterium]|nr:hypothetical protein [Thermoanaerobaculia bacterium]
MRRQYLSLVLAAVALPALATAPARAQATRTWVSGTGDDNNPCSRTAPCKTFTGALAQTLEGGEISVLDPGGYGSVTIDKAISIVADGVEGGILAASANGIVVAAGASDVVSIRGLQIEGAGSGLNGIKLTSGGTLHVENCVIRGFQSATAGNGNGIAFFPTGNSKLVVTNSIVERNGNVGTGGGILVQPTGTGTAKVALSGVTLANNSFGFRANGASSTGPAGIQGGIYDSTASANAGNAFSAITVPGFQGVSLMVSHTSAFSNNTQAVFANGALAQVFLSDFTATANGIGLLVANGANILSHGNNSISGNVTDGMPTVTIGQM